MLEAYGSCYETIYIDKNIYLDPFWFRHAQNSSLNHLLTHIYNNENEAIKF